MQSAFLWLSMAISLAGANRRPARPRRSFVAFGWLPGLSMPRVHVVRRSAWTRAMDELALVPARPRRAASRVVPGADAR